MLEGTLDYRCCREVSDTTAEMLFDGSIEKIDCITQHEDFVHHSVKRVLEMVAPLLRDRKDKPYKHRPGESVNLQVKFGSRLMLLCLLYLLDSALKLKITKTYAVFSCMKISSANFFRIALI